MHIVYLLLLYLFNFILYNNNNNNNDNNEMTGCIIIYSNYALCSILSNYR